jgi:hypothetical protein
MVTSLIINTGCGTAIIKVSLRFHAMCVVLFCVQVLSAAGCELVGGHSSEGPELSAGEY